MFGFGKKNDEVEVDHMAVAVGYPPPSLTVEGTVIFGTQQNPDGKPYAVAATSDVMTPKAGFVVGHNAQTAKLMAEAYNTVLEAARHFDVDPMQFVEALRKDLKAAIEQYHADEAPDLGTLDAVCHAHVYEARRVRQEEDFRRMEDARRAAMLNAGLPMESQFDSMLQEGISNEAAVEYTGEAMAVPVKES